MKTEELKQDISKYEWLLDILKDYRREYNRLSRHNGNFVQIASIEFYDGSTSREKFVFNSHRTINASPFLNAIEQEIKSIEQELLDIKRKYNNLIEFEEIA